MLTFIKKYAIIFAFIIFFWLIPFWNFGHQSCYKIFLILWFAHFDYFFYNKFTYKGDNVDGDETDDDDEDEFVTPSSTPPNEEEIEQNLKTLCETLPTEDFKEKFYDRYKVIDLFWFNFYIV